MDCQSYEGHDALHEIAQETICFPLMENMEHHEKCGPFHQQDKWYENPTK
jgi:hypothetical protein